MLIRFRARNFRSLKEEQELSLVASSLKDSPEAVTQVKGLDLGLVRVAAIYGANASGKSNVIKALAYMSSAVQNSQRQWAPEGPIPREPFLLDPQSKLDPSSFEVDLLLDGVRFHYGFTLNDREILEEWLDAYPAGTKPIRKQMWFTRKGKAFNFGNKLGGDNRAIERLTRPNSLFVSAAAQNNHEALLPIYRWFSNGFGYVPRDRKSARDVAAQMCVEDAFRVGLLLTLQAADLGIVGLEVTEALRTKRAHRDARPRPPEVPEVLQEVGTFLERVESQLNSVESELDSVVLRLKERMGKAFEVQNKMLLLAHRGAAGGSLAFERESESEGTVAFLGLLGPSFQALRLGRSLCVDELDASLHPLLALEIVRLFNDPKLNPRGAQIVFTTHDTNILDRASLRRDQIWFTEKDAEGGTHLYPLTDFKPRKNENLEHGYLQGRYGAVPFISSPGFLAKLHQDKAER